MKKVVFIKNAVILTSTALILRFAGVVFKVWLSREVGSESIGLYQVVLSVYALATSFAVSGISTAITRLVTDELASGFGGSVKKVMAKGILFTFGIAFSTFFMLFLSSESISKYFISDERAVLSIKIIAIGVIFIGLCSCFRAYFIARRKAASSSFSQILEQAVRIILTVIFIHKFKHLGITFTVAAMILGDISAEAVSSFILWILYWKDCKKISSGCFHNGFGKKIMDIALPITGGRYLSTALRTIENTAVPRLLTKSGLNESEALSNFGMLKGMALPLLLFPSSFLGAVSLLLIPELSELKSKNKKISINGTISITVKITTLFGVIFGCIFWFCGKELGFLIYENTTVGQIIKFLSPLVPLMYVDSICDGMLKGLDCQKATFRYSVGDSALRLMLIFLILPRYGMAGFIFIMYLSNILTAFLNLGQLIKTTKLKPDILYWFLLPALIGITICTSLRAILSAIGFSGLALVISLAVLSLILYLLFAFLIGCIKKEDIYYLIK